MSDAIQEANVWPVNENGAIVVQADNGSSVIAGYIPSVQIPQDIATGAVAMVLPATSGGNARSLAIKYSIALG